MTKIDERMRLRKRLVERAIDHAALGSWQEAIDDNVRLLEFGPDAEAYNRIAKAYFELGEYQKSLDYYREALSVNPSNSVARKNVARLEHLQTLTISERDDSRVHADPQTFIIETGKTALTTLIRIAPSTVIMRLSTSEKLSIDHNGSDVWLMDTEGNIVGYLEPHLAHRMVQMMEAGNRYEAIMATHEPGRVKVLIREIYQSPEQRAIVSFPGKLGGDIANFRSYARDLQPYDLDAELAEEDELIEEEATDEVEDDFFRGGGTEEEEVGLEEIEADISNDDDEEES